MTLNPFTALRFSIPVTWSEDIWLPIFQEAVSISSNTSSPVVFATPDSRDFLTPAGRFGACSQEWHYRRCKVAEVVAARFKIAQVCRQWRKIFLPKAWELVIIDSNHRADRIVIDHGKYIKSIIWAVPSSKDLNHSFDVFSSALSRRHFPNLQILDISWPSVRDRKAVRSLGQCSLGNGGRPCHLRWRSPNLHQKLPDTLNVTSLDISSLQFFEPPKFSNRLRSLTLHLSFELHRYFYVDEEGSASFTPFSNLECLSIKVDVASYQFFADLLRATNKNLVFLQVDSNIQLIPLVQVSVYCPSLEFLVANFGAFQDMESISSFELLRHVAVEVRPFFISPPLPLVDTTNQVNGRGPLRRILTDQHKFIKFFAAAPSFPKTLRTISVRGYALAEDKILHLLQQAIAECALRDGKITVYDEIRRERYKPLSVPLLVENTLRPALSDVNAGFTVDIDAIIESLYRSVVD